MKERTRLLYRFLVPIIVLVPPIGLVFAIDRLWHRGVDAQDLLLFGVLFGLTSLGVNVGFHRLLTHRSFQTFAPVRFLLYALGSAAVQGPALDWAAVHLKHHALGDREGDPHSPLEGFWHAHVGWLFKGRYSVEETYYRPIEGDRMAVWVTRTFWLWALAGLAIPFLLGGWSGLVWGGLVRIVFNHHAIWSVNSICHTFGRRPWSTRDGSRNQWFVALVALGEGWHNNHHAFPRVAVHGFRWWQVDLSGYLIRALGALGLAWDVQSPPRPRRGAEKGDSRTEKLPGTSAAH